MSRLPRLHSSPDRPIAGPSMVSTMTSLKRKATADDDEEALDQPKKLPAIGRGHQSRPLQPTRNATNLTTSRLNGTASRPLTRPQPPNLTTSRTTRGTSAPPTSSSSRSLYSSTRQPAKAPVTRKDVPIRTASGPTRCISEDDKKIQAIANKVDSWQSMHGNKLAGLEADMAAERSKVADLEANHNFLRKQLEDAKTQELLKQRELSNVSDEIEALKKRHARELKDLEFDLKREVTAAKDELANMKSRHARELMDLEMDVKKREREIQQLQEDLRLCRGDLERERETVSTLKSTISHQSNARIALGTENHALQSQKTALQTELDMYLATISSLNLKLEASQKEIDALKDETMEAEAVRRKLHNMVQELKGNIRVFCRVRPVLSSDLPSPETLSDSSSSGFDMAERLKEEMRANIAFPDRLDHKEIVVASSSESATGQERKEVYNFNFDRVFEPESSQAEVFEEISLLAQSCTDGYNVCVFAYGQTGSGKSFTMEGGPTATSSGMIPRAVEQVFRVAEELKRKGWEYKMEGQFLEIYNETINDLLGKGEFDKKKHEIKHDPKTNSTRVTDTNVVPLHSPTQVRSLLTVAQSRRSVAATLMNERSSRSHSVFTLRISGHNVNTGERSEGSLNLVDLAGSERLNASGTAADKDRLKETQSINRSLSALGDVIAALGERGEKGDKHIPYRNSKLTYLLQNSLSGNSKTLMILNLSPLAAHLNESLTSLRFATKVNNTTIGTAKKQVRAS
ncbi:kinesin-like nuclear fusion protein [Pleurotus pulmonarius]|nr:kinesin-like nuclear fusion protein [Pleurotus pulmonarius]